jgi:hypothetical protein
LDWFLLLTPDEQEFIHQLVLKSGSLKKLASFYQVSYPTVRLRLDRLIEKIKLIENNKSSNFEARIMQLVVDKKLSFDLAKEIIELYKETDR